MFLIGRDLHRTAIDRDFPSVIRQVWSKPANSGLKASIVTRVPAGPNDCDTFRICRHFLILAPESIDPRAFTGLDDSSRIYHQNSVGMRKALPSRRRIRSISSILGVDPSLGWMPRPTDSMRPAPGEASISLRRLTRAPTTLSIVLFESALACTRRPAHPA
jgi:hypothetical protein